MRPAMDTSPEPIRSSSGVWPAGSSAIVLPPHLHPTGPASCCAVRHVLMANVQEARHDTQTGRELCVTTRTSR